MSTGTGNTMVELFSAEMLFRVCRYLEGNTWQGPGETEINRPLDFATPRSAVGLAAILT